MQRKKVAPKAKKDDTSWGHVADWYHQHVTESDDTYHEKVIKPNLVRVLGDIKGKHILDLACGQGFFREYFTMAVRCDGYRHRARAHSHRA